MTFPSIEYDRVTRWYIVALASGEVVAYAYNISDGNKVLESLQD